MHVLVFYPLFKVSECFGDLKYGRFIFEVGLIQFGFFLIPYLGKEIYGFVDNAFLIVSDVWGSCAGDSTVCRLV